MINGGRMRHFLSQRLYIFTAAVLLMTLSTPTPAARKPDSAQGEILWSRTAPAQAPSEYVFVLVPKLGLFDIDNHPITEAGWGHLQAPDSGVRAILIAPPQTTLDDLRHAIDLITTKGGFARIEISIHAL